MEIVSEFKGNPLSHGICGWCATKVCLIIFLADLTILYAL